MSIDRLQEKIRKLKNPLAVDFGVLPEHIPPYVLEVARSYPQAYERFCKDLLAGLKCTVPAARFDFGAFALLGSEGLDVLTEVLQYAHRQGYYVLLEGVEALSAQSAQRAAQLLLSEACKWYFDGLVIVDYIGSDGLRPYAEKLKTMDKDLFVVARTSNKTAPEIQDLLTGSRLVHTAKVDIVNRFAEQLVCRCGYSQIGVMAAASSADSLRTLRSKYKNIFLLLDGCDFPNANAKNCSFAFDTLGHGAVACAGLSVTAAWLENGEGSYVEQAVCSAERLKKNLSRYISVL